MADRDPSFGNHLRAARLGFYWHERIRRFVRVSDGPNGAWCVEACIPEQLPSRATGEYREQSKGSAWLDLCPALLDALKSDPPRVTLFVDDDGQKISGGGHD